MTSPTTNKSNIHPKENWTQQSDVATNNDVIDAYLSGKKSGRSEWQTATVKLFEQNLAIAQKAAEDLYSRISKIGVNVNSIHLKCDSPSSFVTLLVASIEDYIDPKFLEVIAISRNIKSILDSPDFSINFLFTYSADTLNKKVIDSDGYFMTFYGNK